MLIHTNVIAIVLLAATALTAGFFAYMQHVKRQLYLQLWAVGWGLLALHYGVTLFQPAEGSSLVLAMIAKWLIASMGLAFFCAAQAYAGTRPWRRAALGAAALFGVWIIAFGLHGFPVSQQFGIAAVCFATAWTFWARGPAGRGPRRSVDGRDVWHLGRDGAGQTWI